jgi:uncharacterized protein
MKKTKFSSKFTEFVVKHYVLIVILSLILLVPSVIGYFSTKVNYDMLNYLPDNMETVVGQDELLKDFHKGAFSIVIIEDQTDEQISQIVNEIKEIDHVDTVFSASSLVDAGIPVEILPDDTLDTLYKDNQTVVAIFFDTSTSANETTTAIEDIRSIVDGHAYVSGMSALVTDLRKLCEKEEIVYIIIAVILVLVVMFILLDNWLIPLVILISIAIMIVMNLGSNIMFGEISYITKALSAVLQLAVTMDYSIFLWHSYCEHRCEGKDYKTAMKDAVAATMSSVIGSSATTIAGFIALCFMSFTLGLDLGLVMAKGVLLGVIGSITVLPALILCLHKALEKCNHKTIMPKFEGLSKGIVKFYPIFLVIFVILIPPFFYGYKQTQENVYYNIAESLPEDMEFAIANSKLSEDFGMQNVHMILTSSDLDSEKVLQMSEELEQIDGVKSVLNLENLLGNQIPVEVLPDSVVETLKSENWELSLVISEYDTASDEINTQIDQINGIIKSYDNSALLVGESSCTKDMIELTDHDFQIVNIVSIIVIFIIIAIVEQSISLPIILIIVIETAIFVNLGLPFYTGEQLSFITPICISTIQLGATVDYAILMTTRYKTERMNGEDKKKAIKIALQSSIPSILVSGLGLFAATIGVALYSNVDMISSMCLLMARGAIISIVAVVCFLSPALALCDPLVCRTTKGMKKLIKKEN